MSKDEKSIILDFMIIVLSWIFLWLGVDKLTIILSLLSVTYFDVICLKWELKE
ncbi:hypothetical protein [Anaerococcus porci]|uniref:hypothetical protein n=1 Tax=Anaerococcus porci TaxID=2652269 RepID=UPI002A765B33|nr:hypothetical protein [Anaerococcus porci]MDY3007013.1 hypothetical protein [Anaerococcus porci]